ncbi:MAG: heat-shock protein Hsp20 [Candidatus Saccharibacteria bacterium]|nr:heat-shock protein Hsp20 [Candidatus Saccharibacteria bacterium]
MVQVIRWSDPLSGLSSLRNDLDDIFNTFLSSPGTMTAQLPAMDVYMEDDKQLVAELQIAGFKPEEITISAQDDVLEIRGEHHDTEEKRERKRSYMVRESQASFYRRIMLPKYADQDKVQANFEDGVLRVVVPFKDQPKPKRISIKGLTKSSAKK